MLIYIVRDDTIRQSWVKAFGLNGKIGIFNFQRAGTNGNDVLFVRAYRLLYHYGLQKSIDFGKFVAFLGQLFYCTIIAIFAQQGDNTI